MTTQYITRTETKNEINLVSGKKEKQMKYLTAEILESRAIRKLKISLSFFNPIRWQIKENVLLR